MITPRKSFQESDWGKGWADVVDSQRFHMAAQAAFAEMQMNMGEPKDMSAAAAQACEIAGAKRFLAALMALADPPTQLPRSTSKNLNHRA